MTQNPDSNSVTPNGSSHQSAMFKLSNTKLGTHLVTQRPPDLPTSILAATNTVASPKLPHGAPLGMTSARMRSQMNKTVQEFSSKP